MLAQLSRLWIEIAPTWEIQQLARRLLRVHPLRAADALQLAAAVSILGNTLSDNAAVLDFVSFDQRLNDAARKEGLSVGTG